MFFEGVLFRKKKKETCKNEGVRIGKSKVLNKVVVSCSQPWPYPLGCACVCVMWGKGGWYGVKIMIQSYPACNRLLLSVSKRGIYNLPSILAVGLEEGGRCVQRSGIGSLCAEPAASTTGHSTQC